MKCAAGFDVPPRGRCLICGAAQKSKCLKKNFKDKRAREERRRIELIVTRAEERSQANRRA